MGSYDLSDLEILGREGEIFSPRSELVFKNIFGDPNNKDITLDLVKSILDEPNQEYLDVEFANFWDDGKISDFILDLAVKTKNGRDIDIEIELQNEKETEYFDKKAIYHLSNLCEHQFLELERKGKADSERNRCIVTFILGYEEFQDTPKVMSDICYMDMANMTETFPGDFRIKIIELPKVKKSHEENYLYNWADFFNAKTEDDLDKVANKSDIIKKAVLNLKKLSVDEKFKAEYRDWLKQRYEV